MRREKENKGGGNGINFGRKSRRARIEVKPALSLSSKKICEIILLLKWPVVLSTDSVAGTPRMLYTSAR